MKTRAVSPPSKVKVTVAGPPYGEYTGSVGTVDDRAVRRRRGRRGADDRGDQDHHEGTRQFPHIPGIGSSWP